jgi:beta-1,4-N-acetylglucosaminyltransferase
MKVCIVSSCGGHLTEVRQLSSAYRLYDYFYVLNDLAFLPEDMKGRTYFIRHSERDMLFIVNLIEAFRILKRERPSVILSTGAGLVVPFTIIGKLFFKTRVIYIETFTRVDHLSLTGRIMYKLADRYYVQWQMLRTMYPRAICKGLIN